MKHKIKFVDRDYRCSDGCCYEYWTELYINDELVLERTDLDMDDLKKVLDALGVDQEIEYKVEFEDMEDLDD